MTLARDHGLSAIEAGCHTLYSEDMQHGRAIGGLTIRNPFIESMR